jgi:hypothetical protein
MKKLSFDEFTTKIYSESIYKILNTAIGDKKVKEAFLKKDYQDQKDIEHKLKEFSTKIAKNFVQILKSKGFPEQEISQEEQKGILKGIINEYIQVKE